MVRHSDPDQDSRRRPARWGCVLIQLQQSNLKCLHSEDRTTFMGHASLDCTAVPESTVLPKVAHVIKPLLDARWNGFLGRHSSASVFHSTAWLSALSRT